MLLSAFGRVRFELKHFFRSCIAMEFACSHMVYEPKFFLQLLIMSISKLGQSLLSLLEEMEFLPLLPGVCFFSNCHCWSTFKQKHQWTGKCSNLICSGGEKWDAWFTFLDYPDIKCRMFSSLLLVVRGRRTGKGSYSGCVNCREMFPLRNDPHLSLHFPCTDSGWNALYCFHSSSYGALLGFVTTEWW